MKNAGFPKDWEVKKLKDIAPLQRGFDLPTAKLKRGNYPVVYSNGILNYHSEYQMEAPGVVTGRSGTIGNVTYVEENYWPHNTALWVTSFKGNVPRFIFYLYKRIGLDRFATGSGVPTLNRNDVHAFEVGIPSTREEQTAIAEALSDVDALLSGLDKLIVKKCDLKQAAMQQLLTGKTRLPAFSGKWEVKRLGELGTTYGGLVGKSKNDFGHGAAHYVTFLNVMMNVVIDRGVFDRVDVRFGETQNRVLKGDLLFNGSSETPEEVAMCALVNDDIDNLYLNSFCFGFRIREDAANGLFMAYYMRSPVGRELIKSLAQGSTRYNLSKTALLNGELKLPSKEEQQAIAAVLSDMDAELAALEARRDKTRLLKQGMMQELLTGKTRLIESNVVAFPKLEAKNTEHKANVHFKRSVFAAEIVERLHVEPTFGHVKFQKLIYLAEHMCKVDIDSHYHRDAAGPYDNRAIRSIDSQLRTQKWFDAQKVDERYQYVPMEKRGGYKQYFDRYFADVGATFDKVIDTFRSWDTERCEIVATLFEAWHDLLERQVVVSDDAIVREVLNNWHDSKKRIDEARWRKALGWMREKGFVPTLERRE